MFIPINGGQGISRPFVVGLILLLVFLGLQSDLVPSKQPDTDSTPQANTKESAKERVGICVQACFKEPHRLSWPLLPADHFGAQQIQRKAGGTFTLPASHF